MTITIQDIDDMSPRVLSMFWRTLPLPLTDEERDVVERLAIRCEGCGLVDKDGKLVAL